MHCAPFFFCLFPVNICMCSYNIGGHQYSFNDLEHGVLRGNKVPSFHISRQLPKGDPRLSAVFAEPDCRIHFALNCGAVSCPAISLYTAEGIDTELDVAAAGFCESSDGIAVDEATKTLWLSKLLSWYESYEASLCSRLLRFNLSFFVLFFFELHQGHTLRSFNVC